MAHEQRADAVGAPPLPRQPPADHELLALDVLDLDPRAGAPARLIAGVQALGHDALEPLGPRGLEQRRAAARMRRRNPPCRPAQAERVQAGPPLLIGQRHQGVPVEVEQVEDGVDDGRAGRQAAHRAGRGDVHAPLEALEARPPVIAEGHDLPVEHRLAHPEVAEHPAHLGVGLGDLVEVAALQAQASRLDVGDRAHPVPLDLEGPALSARGKLPGAGQHRQDPLRHRLAAGVGRRVHAVDHPVLLGAVPAPLANREQPVAARQALAVEGDLDLLLLPQVGLERALVPDRHGARPVLAGRDLAVEVQVLERMVLGVDRQPVVGGVGGDPVGDRPRGQDAIVLEPQVPVQPRGVVLLDDEPRLARRRRRLARGLAGLLEVALGAVGVQLVRRHLAVCR